MTGVCPMSPQVQGCPGPVGDAGVHASKYGEDFFFFFLAFIICTEYVQ